MDWNVILSGIAYAALTGIFNLIFSKKTQIEQWCAANPRLAAVGMFMRSVGFDPHNLWAFATLLITKKLPAIKLDKSAVVKAELRKIAEQRRDADETVHFGPPLVLLLVAFALSQQACNRDVRPCSPEDLATGQLALHNAQCAAKRQASFPNLPDETCDATPGCKAIVDGCDRWVDERCK